MITPEAIQLRRLAAGVLSDLQVSDSVSIAGVRELTEGVWLIGFEDRAPDARFAVFDVEVSPRWSRDQIVDELRATLREKLWICPRCQRRAQIRRIVDQEAYRVACANCGRFTIEGEQLARFWRPLESRSG
jgi:hypothetical protein